MEITSNHKEITVTSQESTGYKYLHVVTYQLKDTLVSNITETSSTFTLDVDGYYIVSEYIVDINDTSSVEDIIANNEPSEEINILVLCNMEECLNKLNKRLLSLIMKKRCVNETDPEVYERNMLFITYSSLKYLGELNHFCEAQRLLVEMEPCNCNCNA